MEAGIYRHYKGGLYQVLGVGQHTETNEIVVIYIPLQHEESHTGPRLRVRPANGPNGFCSNLPSECPTCGSKIRYNVGVKCGYSTGNPDPDKWHNESDVPRFTYIGTGE
jgi:hypothetical protein